MRAFNRPASEAAQALYLRGAPVRTITQALGISRASFYRYREGWKVDHLTVGVIDTLRAPVSYYETCRVRLDPAYLDLHLARLLAERLRMKVRFKPSKMPTLFAAIEDGSVDLALGLLGDSPARLRRFAMSEPYANLTARPTGTLVTRCGVTLSPGDPHSFVGKRVGTMGMSLSHEWLQALPGSFTLKTFGTPSALHYALLSNQVDATLEGYSHQAPFVARHPEFQIQPPLIDYRHCKIRALLRPGDDRMHDRVNEALMALRREHLLEPWEERLFHQ